MENVIMKKCFGSYVFEDIECMQCSICSACQIDIRKRKLETKKLKMPKACHDCENLDNCKKSGPEGCLGDCSEYGREYCNDCKCEFNCYNKCKKDVSVLCIKSVKCRIHNSTQFITFNAGDKYDMAIVGKELHAKDRYDVFEKIFNDYNNEIIKNYFIIDIVE